MIKLIFLLIGAGAGIMLLRVRMANANARNASNNAVGDMKKGKLDFDSMAAALDMIIRSKSLPSGFDKSKLEGIMAGIDGKQILGKFTIKHIERNFNGDHIVISEGIVQDFIPEKGHVDVVYPCWLQVTVNNNTNHLDCYSSFPQNKDQQYLLEDLADYIHRSAAIL